MIKYKILSDSALRWARHASTAEEIWEVITDGSFQRSGQFLAEMFEGAPKDDLTVEVLSHMDDYISEDKLSIKELRIALAYLTILKKSLGSSDRTTICIHEACYTKIDKLSKYCHKLEKILHEGSPYSATLKQIVSKLLDIGHVLRVSDVDVWTKVNKSYFTESTYPIELRPHSKATSNYLIHKLIHFYCDGLGLSKTQLDELLRAKGAVTPKTYGWDTFKFKRDGIDDATDYLNKGVRLMFDKRGLINTLTYNRMLLFQRK